MSRISEVFAKLKSKRRGGFIPFITAGDPDLSVTEELLRELAKAGADIIEVGVPFSDPVADGPVIQRASERALERGTNVKSVLECVAAVKRRTDVSIVLFSYYNPFLQFGLDHLATAASLAAGASDFRRSAIRPRLATLSCLLPREIVPTRFHFAEHSGATTEAASASA